MRQVLRILGRIGARRVIGRTLTAADADGVANAELLVSSCSNQPAKDHFTHLSRRWISDSQLKGK